MVVYDLPCFWGRRLSDSYSDVSILLLTLMRACLCLTADCNQHDHAQPRSNVTLWISPMDVLRFMASV